MKSYFLSGTSWLALLIGMEAYRRGEEIEPGSPADFRATVEFVDALNRAAVNKQYRRVTYYG